MALTLNFLTSHFSQYLKINWVLIQQNAVYIIHPLNSIKFMDLYTS